MFGGIHRIRFVISAMIALSAIALSAAGEPAKPTPPPASNPASIPASIPASTPTKAPTPAPAAAAQSAPSSSRSAQSRLIREGSHLVQVPGTMHADEGGANWKFVIDPAHPTLPGYELSVLPCTKLGEMQRMVEVTETQKVVFEASGEVFAYKGRNYFLPEHAALVAAGAPPAATQPSGQSGATAGEASSRPGEDADAEPEEADSAAAIAKGLDRAVGPMKQSLDTGLAAKPDESAKSKPKALKQDAQILWRRGRMTRDGGGSWTFVFDADAAGLADPPLTLLPCLLLERMETYAGTSETGALMLISGRVLTYHDRNYLLPTVYQIPRERTQIKP